MYFIAIVCPIHAHTHTCAPHTAHIARARERSAIVLFCAILHTHTHTHGAYNVHMIASLRPNTLTHTRFFFFFRRRVKNFSKRSSYETGSEPAVGYICLCARCFGDLLCFICSSVDNSKYKAKHMEFSWCQAANQLNHLSSQLATHSKIIKMMEKCFFVYKNEAIIAILCSVSRCVR